jgi:hypothetical protein
VTYDELATLTHAVTADPHWPGPAVTVLPLRDRRWWARAWTHTVRYGPRAPAWVVAHELAHVASGDFGHGERWRACEVELAQLVQGLTKAGSSVFADQLPSPGDSPSTPQPPSASWSQITMTH